MIICKFDHRVHHCYLSNFWDFLVVHILSIQYWHIFFMTCTSYVSLLFVYILPGDATGASTCRTCLSLCLAVRNRRTIFLLFGFYSQQSIYSPFIVTYSDGLYFVHFSVRWVWICKVSFLLLSCYTWCKSDPKHC